MAKALRAGGCQRDDWSVVAYRLFSHFARSLRAIGLGTGVAGNGARSRQTFYLRCMEEAI
jgi:hypothetical protein